MGDEADAAREDYEAERDLKERIAELERKHVELQRRCDPPFDGDAVKEADRRAREEKLAAMRTLELLTEAVCEKYLGDPSMPSVVLSKLIKGRNDWYASVVRYGAKYGEGKTVVVNATAQTMLGAIVLLANKWTGAAQKQAVEKLEQHLSIIGFKR